MTAVAVKDLSLDYLNDLAVRLGQLGLDESVLASVRHAAGMTLAHHAKATVARVKRGDISTVH